MPCSFMKLHQCFRETAASIITYTDAAGSRFLLNVGVLLAEYLMLHFRKQQHSVNSLTICVLFFSVMLVM